MLLNEPQTLLRDLIIRCWSIPRGKNNEAAVEQWNRDVNELLTVHCYDSPALFHTAVLGRPPLFDYQLEMCRLVLENDVSVIASGNSLGKSFWASSIALWYLFTRKDSIVITTSSSHSNLNTVLWKNIRDAWQRSRFPLGGRMRAAGAVPQILQIGNEHFCIGQSTTSCEKMAGQHAASGKSLVLVDETSGISEAVYEGIRSLAADKYVFVGNPLVAYGPFWDVYQLAEKKERGYGCMKVPCTRSPDILEWKSKRGLACQSFQEQIKSSDGEGSAYYLSHFLSEFPTETSESLIPREWLDLADGAEYVPCGLRRMGVDLSLGVGRDYTCIIVRDENGILHLERSNRWKLKDSAKRVDALMRQFNVAPHNVYFDANGPGSDYSNQLQGLGIVGAREFVGSRNSGRASSRYANNRTFAAYQLKRRLDPDRMNLAMQGISGEAPPKPQQFSIPKEYMKLLRPQLAALAVKCADENKIALLPKETVAERLGCSPDCGDALQMSFSW